MKINKPHTDLRLWITDMLPSFLRKQSIITILLCAIRPLISIYNALMALWQKSETDASYNGQICHIRKALNDMLDPERRRFMVMDTTSRGSMLFTVKGDYSHTNDESICRILCPEMNEPAEVTYIPPMLIGVPLNPNNSREPVTTKIYASLPVCVSEERDKNGQNTFVVVVPQDIYDKELYKVMQLVEKYKLPTKQVKYIKK